MPRPGCRGGRGWWGFLPGWEGWSKARGSRLCPVGCGLVRLLHCKSREHCLASNNCQINAHTQKNIQNSIFSSQGFKTHFSWLAKMTKQQLTDFVLYNSSNNFCVFKYNWQQKIVYQTFLNCVKTACLSLFRFKQVQSCCKQFSWNFVKDNSNFEKNIHMSLS